MEDTNHKQANPFIAGVTGAAIGIGIGALATKVLSDKKMRNQIMKTASDVKEKLGDSMDRAFHELRPISRRLGIGKKRVSSIAHRIRISGVGKLKRRGA